MDRASQARVETREAVESVIGEVEGPLTQEHVDAANRVIGIDNREARERQEPFTQPDPDIVGVIRGDHAGLLTPEDVDRAIAYMFAASKGGTKIHPFQSDSELHPEADPAVAEAWFNRAMRASRADMATLEDIKTFQPGLTDEQALEQLTLYTLLDKHASGAAIDAGSVGSIDLTTDLVSRGMNPLQAQRWTKWANR